MNPLAVLSEQAQQLVLQDCSKELIALADRKAATGQPVTALEARQAILSVLKAHEITSNREEMAKQIVLLLRRRQNLNLASVDLVKAGFDKVWSSQALDGLILFSGGIGGPTTFHEIRQAIDTVFDQQWDEAYEKVLAMGHPPTTDSSAYWWCTYNKVLHRSGRLGKHRETLLMKISWWRWSHAFGERWRQQWERVRTLGECPRAGTAEYSWVRTQRRLYDAHRLPDDKVRMCEEIPWWTWASLASRWRAMYARVAALKQPPPTASEEYDWLKRQRRLHAAGELPADRIRMLEAVEWWSWEAAAATVWLRQWEAIRTMPSPPSSYSKEYGWVRKQRQRHQAGRLESERIRRCEEISWWSW